MKLLSLYLYPVKSLAGIAVDAALATAEGLALTIGDQRVYDRQWMVIKPNGQFLTQRQVPAMALIRTELTITALVLHKEGMPSCSVPYTLHAGCDDEQTTGIVWKDTCDVQTEQAHINQWLTAALNYPLPLRLVRMAKDAKRTQSKPDLLGAATHTHFADAAPYLIANKSSLDTLNQALVKTGEEAVTMLNFRPNIVIDGLPPFTEHTLAAITFTHQTQPTEFKLCYPCQRCIITTINPNTAEKNPRQQPFKQLVELNPMPDNHKAPAFGVNATLHGSSEQPLRIS